MGIWEIGVCQDKLVKRMSESLGVDQDATRKAILTTADHLKRKLPEPIFHQIKIVLDMPEASDEETRELGLFRIP